MTSGGVFLMALLNFISSLNVHLIHMEKKGGKNISNCPHLDTNYVSPQRCRTLLIINGLLL